MEQCTFTPAREGAKTSEKYLRRMGKTTSTPQDFFNYHKVCRDLPALHRHICVGGEMGGRGGKLFGGRSVCGSVSPSVCIYIGNRYTVFKTSRRSFDATTNANKSSLKLNPASSPSHLN